MTWCLRVTLIGLLAFLASGCSDGTTDWAEASSKVGQTTTVCGPVASIEHVTESWGEATFLNLGIDYPNPDRFTIVIWESDPSLDDILAGAVVCGHGEVTLYEGVAQLELDDLSDIRVPELEEMPDPDYGPGPY